MALRSSTAQVLSISAQHEGKQAQTCWRSSSASRSAAACCSSRRWAASSWGQESTMMSTPRQESVDRARQQLVSTL